MVVFEGNLLWSIGVSASRTIHTERPLPMTRTATHMVGAPQLALVYAATFIGGYLFFITMRLVLVQLFAFRFPSILTIVLMVFVSGYFVGHFWCSKEAVRPVSRRVWRIATLCTLVSVALYAVLIWGSHLFQNETNELYAALTSGSVVKALILLASICSLPGLLIIRLGIGVGIKLAAN